MILRGYMLSFAVVFGVIGIITLLQKLFSLNGEVSRKLIHIFVGATIIPMLHYLRGTVHMIIIPVIFVLVNWLSVRFSIFKAMERKEKDGKKDYGTVYFAVCMTIMSVLSYSFPALTEPYGIAVACLSLGDGAAAILGTVVKKHNPQLITGKTLVGCVACFVAAVVAVYIAGWLLKINIMLWKVLCIALATAVLELVGRKLDNFTVSLGVMLLAYFLKL